MEIRGYITPDENAVPARINAAVLNRIVELQQTVLDAVPNARELSVSDLLSMPGVMVNDRIDQDAVSSAVLAVHSTTRSTPSPPPEPAKARRSPACSSTTASKLKKS